MSNEAFCPPVEKIRWHYFIIHWRLCKASRFAHDAACWAITLPMQALEGELLVQEVIDTKQQTSRPFGLYLLARFV